MVCLHIDTVINDNHLNFNVPMHKHDYPQVNIYIVIHSSIVSYLDILKQ